MAKHSDAEKAGALEIVASEGIGPAHDQTGIAKPTLSRWAKAAGIDLTRFQSEQTRAAVETTKANAEQKKANLALRFVDLAEMAAERAHELISTASLRDVVGAWDYAIKNHQLLTGGATSRNETGDPRVAAEETVDELTARRAKKQAA